MPRMTTEEIKAAREFAERSAHEHGPMLHQHRLASSLKTAIDEIEHQRADIAAMLLTHQTLADAVQIVSNEPSEEQWTRIRKAILVMAGRRDA